MLSTKQEDFKKSFLNGFKQRFYFWKQLPMALLAGVKLVELSEEKAVSTVPFKNRNKNPFKSMYFAVQSMAAELSTASLAMLALKGVEGDVALIITENGAEFSKKAQSKIAFTCTDYDNFKNALDTLQNPGDVVSVTAKTVGTDANGDVVSVFWFTWSFKRRK